MAQTKVNMMMTSDRDGITESGKVIPAGTKVEYEGHVPLGMVLVTLPDESKEIMHPGCFPELR